MQHKDKSIYKSQHIFIFDYRNRFRRCNAQTLIFSVWNFRVDYEIDVAIAKLQRERRATAEPPIRGVIYQHSSGDIMRNPYRQAV